MSGIIAESQRRVGPTGIRTAFERNLLPRFAEWAAEQIEQWKPDYLVPEGTKGVHVLDAALAYAREELGAPIAPPVLYSTGLRYLPSDVLRESRVMIVEDAVKTGASLTRDWREIEGHEVAEIKAIAFMGRSETSPKRLDVDYYLRVNQERYTQYLWQLTELVVARGLPPEVDHFVFELRLPRRLTPAWQELQAQLARCGSLTVDGPVSKMEEIQPMTLHFPRLPGMWEGSGRAVADGPNKVRFFPDPDGERVFVLPISFPGITLGRGRNTSDLTEAQAREALRSALGGQSAIGELLIEKATKRDPITVFRAISTAREVEAIAGVARLLGATMPGSVLITHRDVFDRLYGWHVGKEVSSRVAEHIDAALAEGESGQVSLNTETEQLPEPTYLDAAVASATRELAESLKQLRGATTEEDLKAAGEGKPAQRGGLSMPELAKRLPSDDPLFASRCLTFGLAMTTLVPYIDSSPASDGSLTIERRYWVSEPVGEGPYRDLDVVRREKSEQALAVICNRLQQRCKTYRGKPIPIKLLTSLVAILRVLVLDEQSIELKAVQQVEEPRLVLLDSVETVSVDPESSAYLRIVAIEDNDEGVTPTELFRSAYDMKSLDLDVDEATEEIETHVDQLAGFIDNKKLGQGKLDMLLKGWAMSTDRRLGLTHVRRSLNVALADLRDPLKDVLSRESHPHRPKIADNTRAITVAAHTKLELLGTDWSAPAKRLWKAASGRREQRLLASLGAPTLPVELYSFAGALIGLIAANGALVERLHVASARAWQGDDEAIALEEAATVAASCARVRRALSSLTSDEAPEPSLSSTGRLAIEEAAANLLDLIEQLGAFVAALAGVFRGRTGGRMASRRPSPRHISALSLDLAGSSFRAEAVREERSHNRWVREGLDLATQWTRTFGGWERPERQGDGITVEFDDDGDPSALAAAAVLCHTHALRSSGIKEQSWKFHSGVDYGEVEDDANRVSVNGRCLNRATNLSKQGDGRGEARQVLLTNAAATRCSGTLRQEPIAHVGKSVPIATHEDQIQTVNIDPYVLDSARAFKRLTARISEVARRLDADLPPPSESAPPLPIKPKKPQKDERGGAEAQREGS